MGRRFPELHDPEWLRQQYSAEFRSAKEIAEQIGCSESAVNGALRRAGVLKLPTAMHRVLRARLDREREEGVAA